MAQICQRLDGIPLAIELAAARLRSMTVEQVADRLDNAFHLLTSGSRTVLPGQQTIKATIVWSYSLLPIAEKLLLSRLPVFAGGWSLEAAEQVCSDPQGAGKPEDINAKSRLEPGDILDLLGNLVEKSLVALEISASGTGRYRMLETVRQYACEKLDQSRLEQDGKASGDGSPMMQDRHLDYFLQLVLQAELHLRALGGQGGWTVWRKSWITYAWQ